MAPVYVLDACVLYPVVLRDLLLTLSALDAFEARWTEQIIGEMARNVLATHPELDPARFDERVVGSMRRAFPDALIAGTGTPSTRWTTIPRTGMSRLPLST